jgi:hypothetical protein
MVSASFPQELGGKNFLTIVDRLFKLGKNDSKSTEKLMTDILADEEAREMMRAILQK